MKKVVIVHGWGAGPDWDWIPWLKAELEKQDVEVFVPTMPHTEAPVIEAWVKVLRDVVRAPDEDTYFVGHSIGCQAILRYLETLDAPVGGAVFVAGWFDLENLEDEEVEAVARPWIETPMDLEKIGELLPRSTLIISDDDPYGALDFNIHKFTELGSNIVVLPNAGHITAEEGYSEVPQILEELNRLS